MGGFGPNPDRVFPILRAHNVVCIQGNYDHSIGNELDDCACGYTDERDNHFAQLSYDYTLARTSAENKSWLRELPIWARRNWAQRRVLLAHGSPRRVNEFLWESTSPDDFLKHLLDTHNADILLVTHTGLHWARELDRGRVVINVGAIGRPANDGRQDVWYAVVEYGDDPQSFSFEHIPISYDHNRLATEMREQRLPEEFVETILSGWWTTCLEVLPAKERDASRH